MSTIRDLLKVSGYSDKAIKYYENHLNVGNIENPDAQCMFTGPCGDTMEIFLKIKSGVITEAKFQAIGCAGSFSSGSALTEMIIGKTLHESESIDEKDILAHLGAMPEEKVHCARLTVLTLKKAIEQYKNKVPKEINKMKKIIAIPLENGILCSHFGHCQQFAIIETDSTSVTGETLIIPPPHEPGLLPGWLAEKGVTDVIAGGMGQRAINLFNQQNINVFVGATIKKPADLAKDLLNDTLVAGANYCDH